MTQHEAHILDEIKTRLQQRLQLAQIRVKNAQHDRMYRYYKGQVDALKVMLQDLETLKFDFGIELEPEATKPEQETSSISVPIPTPSPYQALADDAVKRGIITQRYSHFYHELLPGKRVKGYQQLYQAFETSPAFRQAIQEACASPKLQTSDEGGT